jgi:hypothetical protein
MFNGGIMKNEVKILRVGVAVAAIGLFGTSIKTMFVSQQLESAKVTLSKIQEQDSADTSLGQYAINMMLHTAAGSKLSNAGKQILARDIVDVANDVYEDNLDHKKAFIVVVAIESGFQKGAQSPTGPRGLTQVAKKALQEGLSLCGLPASHDSDAWNEKINLYAGACYFRFLLEKNNNDPYIAIVAYNKGPYSDSIKSYAKSGNLNDVEALKYVAKFNYLKRTVTDAKTPNNPTYEKTPNTDRVKSTVNEGGSNVESDRLKSSKKAEDTPAKAAN